MPSAQNHIAELNRKVAYANSVLFVAMDEVDKAKMNVRLLKEKLANAESEIDNLRLRNAHLMQRIDELRADRRTEASYG